jgi:hypothetical protein
VRFFVLDTDYLDPKQLQWIEAQLKDDLFFQVISRTGKTVDSGSIHRQPQPAPSS